MEHPLINNIDYLSVDELQGKISELNRKLGYASRIGNAQLVYQIRLALDTYSAKYQEKMAKIYSDQHKNNPDFTDKINIS